MPTDTHIHILLTHTYSTVNMRIPNRCTNSHTYMYMYTHGIHTQHAPYKHTCSHHTHIHNIHTYMRLNSGLSQNKACPKFVSFTTEISNREVTWNMYQCPYCKHQHSATPTSTHQYPTHSHTDILPTHTHTHWYPTQPPPHTQIHIPPTHTLKGGETKGW